jgi:hypothetical protein
MRAITVVSTDRSRLPDFDEHAVIGARAAASAALRSPSQYSTANTVVALRLPLSLRRTGLSALTRMASADTVFF